MNIRDRIHAMREAHVAKVQARAEQGYRDEWGISPTREQRDYEAGCAFRDGDLDKARGILVKALIEHPDGSDVWAARLEQVNAKAEAARQATPDVPPVGIHRDGGPTTRAIYGTFPRSPDPEPPHHCPGCTTVTERDGKTIVTGPKIEEHRELCQSCEVLISIGRRPPERAESEAAGL